MRKFIFGAIVLFITSSNPAFAGCITGPTPETTTCNYAEIAAMQTQYQPLWWKARFAQPSVDEQHRQAILNEDLRERAVTFDSRVRMANNAADAAIVGQLADEEAAREGKARKSYFWQSLAGAIVAPLAQAGADRLSGYGGRGYYGSYGRGGGYYPGTGYSGGRDPGRQTQPIRVYCNPRAGQYCPY